MDSNTADNKRIAKNTMLLYFRMLLIMAVTLYTSRVVLNTLGVEDYGIYNVVGGLVAMFSLFSSSISVSISRHITFELGKGDEGDVNKVFSSAVNIQIFMILIIFILAETVGLWFLNTHMVFPPERSFATNCVYQLTILTFIVNLFSIPYNAAIIAYERMKTFAYVSVVEAAMKLGVAFAIAYSGYDKLVLYAVLMMTVSVMTRVMYGIYCKRNLVSCTYRRIFDKEVLKNMFSYAGWTYIGTSSALFRDQGGNILINLFFGPIINAAYGIAAQVQTAVNQFAINFTTALNPQLIKSYAAEEYDRVKFLIKIGVLGGYFLLLLIALPIFFNTPFILKFWLGKVPPETVTFVKLSIIFAMSESISNPLMKAASANGHIRNYQLLVGGIQFLNFPLTYLFFLSGFPSFTVLIVAIVLSQCCMLARLYILRSMINLSAKSFFVECYIRIIAVTLLAMLVPWGCSLIMDECFLTLVLSTLLCTISSVFIIYSIGCTSKERKFIKEEMSKIKQRFNK